MPYMRRKAASWPSPTTVARNQGLSPSGSGRVTWPHLLSLQTPPIGPSVPGETFYTWQRGIPELRQALARYHARHFDRQFAEDEFLVTGGGMQAI